MTTDTLELPEPIARVRRWTTNSVTVDIAPALLPTLTDGASLYSADQVAAAVLAEREKCARICDQIGMEHQQRDEQTYSAGKKFGAFQCASAIRNKE